MEVWSLCTSVYVKARCSSVPEWRRASPDSPLSEHLWEIKPSQRNPRHHEIHRVSEQPGAGDVVLLRDVCEEHHLLHLPGRPSRLQRDLPGASQGSVLSGERLVLQDLERSRGQRRRWEEVQFGGVTSVSFQDIVGDVWMSVLQLRPRTSASPRTSRKWWMSFYF